MYVVYKDSRHKMFLNLRFHISVKFVKQVSFLRVYSDYIYVRLTQTYGAVGQLCACLGAGLVL